MTSEALRFQRVKDLFERAVERSADERQAFLTSVCAADPTLAAEVQSLLAAHDAPGDPLETPAARTPPATPAGEPASPDHVGRILGAYRIERVIGHGGMGSVYEAAPIADATGRRVALKLIKRDMDSDLAIRRFRHEREILATLDHPNIAGLLDGGVATDGRPFFVMEYVDGEPITRYCDRRRLGLHARLRLFRQVCSAVNYAHRNLVVHRDIKPGNILVSADGTAKLLDFGIARMLGEDEGPETAPLTRGGVRALTPEYASPEMIRGGAITTAADIYALGVVLFELLAGRRPFRFEDQTLHGIERTICNEPPPRPSVVATDEAARVAGERSPAHYRRRLSGELDNIVAMALRKEPERRYESVKALAEDVQRHLDGRPIVAHRDWAGYRLGKFVRRNALGVVASALLVASLIGGVIATTARARRAETERLRAARASAFLAAALISAGSGEQGRDPTVAEVLHRAAERARHELAAEPDLHAEIEAAVGLGYLGLGRAAEAERHLTTAKDLSERVHGPRSRGMVVALRNLGAVARARADWPRADSIYRQALELDESLGRSPDTLRAGLLEGLGLTRRALGDLPGAALYLRASLELRRDLPAPEPEDPAPITGPLRTP